jgi:hypothetical protein
MTIARFVLGAIVAKHLEILQLNIKEPFLRAAIQTMKSIWCSQDVSHRRAKSIYCVHLRRVCMTSNKQLDNCIATLCTNQSHFPLTEEECIRLYSKDGMAIPWHQRFQWLCFVSGQLNLTNFCSDSTHPVEDYNCPQMKRLRAPRLRTKGAWIMQEWIIR